MREFLEKLIGELFFGLGFAFLMYQYFFIGG